MGERRQLQVRLPVELHAELVGLAAVSHRSLNAEIVLRLENAVALGRAGVRSDREQGAGEGALAERVEEATGPDRRPQSEPIGRGAGESEGTGSVRSVSESRSASVQTGPGQVITSPADAARAVAKLVSGGSSGRDVRGAGTGLCVHRVKLDAFCKEC